MAIILNRHGDGDGDGEAVTGMLRVLRVLRVLRASEWVRGPGSTHPRFEDGTPSELYACTACLYVHLLSVVHQRASDMVSLLYWMLPVGVRMGHG